MTEYRSSQKVIVPLLLSLSLSIIMILMITVTFFLGLLSSANNPLIPGMVSGLSVIPFFGISFAFYLLKRPIRILVAENGLSVEWLIGQKTFPWNTISRLELKKPGIGQNWASSFTGKKNASTEIVVVLDDRNKKIVEIGDNIEHFSDLVQEIRQRSSMAQGKTTFDADEHLQKTIRRQKKSRIFLLIIGIFIAALSVTMATISLVENHNKKLLKTQGQVIEATISNHYIYNITPRLEYTFTTVDGQTFSKNVMVHRPYWETLEENGSVPVIYVPSKPKQNKLLHDNADEEFSFPLFIVVPTTFFVFLISVVCVTMYFLKITDLKFEDGHFKIVRIGDVDSKIIPDMLVQDNDMDSHKDDGNIPTAVEIEPVAASVPKTAQLESLPKGLKAIGILNIIIGVLGILWSGGRILLAYLFINNPGLIPGNMALPEETSLIFLEHFLSAILALFLAISGIGILLFKNWARILAIVVVAVKLLQSLVGVVMTFLAIASNAEGLSPDQEYVINATLAFCIFFVILTMIYPAIVLILLQRKTTREVFRKHKEDGQIEVAQDLPGL